MVTDARTLIALAVQHALVEQGMTQEELAARISARPSDLSARLSGEIPIEDRDVVRIAEGLGLDPAELVERADLLGWRSAQSAVGAALGTPGPPSPPRHDAAFFQALIHEAAQRPGVDDGDDHG